MRRHGRPPGIDGDGDRHLCAVTRVSMNLNPSNRGANLSSGPAPLFAGSANCFPEEEEDDDDDGTCKNKIDSSDFSGKRTPGGRSEAAGRGTEMIPHGRSSNGGEPCRRRRRSWKKKQNQGGEP